jgi:hypothetical protein
MNQLIDSINKATCDYLDARSHPDRIACIDESLDLLRGLVAFCNSRVVYLVKKRDESRGVIAQHSKLLSQVQAAMTPAEERIQAQKAKEARLQKCAEQKAKLLADLKKAGETNEVAKNCEAETKGAEIKNTNNVKQEPEQSEDDMLLAAYESYLGAQPRDSNKVVAEILNSLLDKVFDAKRPGATVSKEDESGFFSDTEVTTPKLPLIAKSAAKLAQIARSSAAANAGSFVEQQPEHIDLEECLNLISTSEHVQRNSGVKRTSKTFVMQ